MMVRVLILRVTWYIMCDNITSTAVTCADVTCDGTCDIPYDDIKSSVAVR